MSPYLHELGLAIVVGTLAGCAYPPPTTDVPRPATAEVAAAASAKPAASVTSMAGSAEPATPPAKEDCAGGAPKEGDWRPKRSYASHRCEANDAAERIVSAELRQRYGPPGDPNGRVEVSFGCAAVKPKLDVIVFEHNRDRGRWGDTWLFRRNGTYFEVLLLERFMRRPRPRGGPPKLPYSVLRGRVPAKRVDAIANKLRAYASAQIRELLSPKPPPLSGHAQLSVPEPQLLVLADADGGRAARYFNGRFDSDETRNALPMAAAKAALSQLAKVAKPSQEPPSVEEQRTLMQWAYDSITKGWGDPLLARRRALNLTDLVSSPGMTPILLHVANTAAHAFEFDWVLSALKRATGWDASHAPDGTTRDRRDAADAYVGKCARLW
jgi:hypothetical protein